ncbi:MAG: polymer-forming cytoskeletal protein [Anaerolineales bacterium]
MKPKQRILLTFLLTLGLVFALPGGVRADGPIYGDTVEAGEVIERDLLLVGREVSIAGTVNGNVAVLGNRVVLTGVVDGNLIVAGQNVLIDGLVTGTVYTAALTVELGPGAVIGRDLDAVTVSLTAAAGAEIRRDLNAIGLDAGLNGRVGRDLHTVIGPIQLYNGLMRLLGFDEFTIELQFNLPAPPPEGNGRWPAGRGRLLLPPPVEQQPPVAFDWAGWAGDRLRLWGVLFALGAIALWRARTAAAQASRPLLSRPGQTLALGLLALVLAIGLFGVGLLLFILVFALGLGLNFLGLWQLTIALWLAAAALLTLFLIALWAFLAYGTKLIVIYALSTWLFEKLFHKKALWLDLLALLSGTLLYTLLAALPYVGWIIVVLVSAAGAGAAWLAWQANRRPVAADLPGVPLPEAAKKSRRR